MTVCSSTIENNARCGSERQICALKFVLRFPHVDSIKIDENLVLLSGSDNARALLFRNTFAVMIPKGYPCLYDART
ncbi:MAG: hypothetical protein BCS36_00180 [Desulfovibrio sp. MES5]|nr:MAG: hypothetical protein BCS36_00180 [Desulfovibrio sp. MES5]